MTTEFIMLNRRQLAVNKLDRNVGYVIGQGEVEKLKFIDLLHISQYIKELEKKLGINRMKDETIKENMGCD